MAFLHMIQSGRFFQAVVPGVLEVPLITPSYFFGKHKNKPRVTALKFGRSELRGTFAIIFISKPTSSWATEDLAAVHLSVVIPQWAAIADWYILVIHIGALALRSAMTMGNLCTASITTSSTSAAVANDDLISSLKLNCALSRL
jgi:hypothetical protein